MIINGLKLCTFAGITDIPVTFKKGLNVILGPNEAGKSTLVNALDMALFTPTACGKRQFDKEILPFMPLSGGDTITVELTFEVDGMAYHLTKSWGKQSVSKLKLPKGGILTDPQAIQGKLQELLVLSTGTFRSVLFANQSELSSTVDNLTQDSEPAQDLASVLRKAVFETDGVSVERLGQSIENMLNDYFSRWDRQSRRPEGNRGIEYPWEKGVGNVLRVYYRKEVLRQAVDKAKEYEKQDAQLSISTDEQSKKIKGLEDFIRLNRPVFDAAIIRTPLVQQKEGLLREVTNLHQINKEWPELKQRLSKQRAQKRKLQKKLEALGKELRRANAYESKALIREKFYRARKIYEDWCRATAVIDKMKAIEKKDYEALNSNFTEMERLRGLLKIAKLMLTMTVKKSMEICMTSDFGKESLHSLKAGQSLELSAGAQMSVSHADWIIKVKFGEIDSEQLKRKLKTTSQGYRRLLNKLAITDLDEAKRVYEAYANQRDEVDGLEERLNLELEGHTYQELKEQAKSPKVKPRRLAITIAGERGRTEGTLATNEYAIQENEKRLSELVKKYKTQSRLLDLLVDKRAEMRDLDRKLQKLKPLPKSIKDPEEFVEDFEKKRDVDLPKEKADLTELLVKQAEFQASAPEETPEEIEVQLREAQHAFEQVEMRANALAEIRTVFEQIKSEKDTQTLNPWLKELGRVLEPLTADRYNKIEWAEDSDSKAIRKDGQEIPFDLLSTGTKVGLGLALRLSMARYFLEGLRGFLVMDDPFVDIDPKRQSAAAKVIQNFAREKQVIIVTCHPSHADLLGGHTITL